jgi:hypothetical protein
MVAAVVAITFLGLVRLPVAAALALGVGPTSLSLAGVTVTVPRLVVGMGPVGIWWGFVVSNVVGAALAVAWFKRGTWRDADVRGGPVDQDRDGGPRQEHERSAATTPSDESTSCEANPSDDD